MNIEIDIKEAGGFGNLLSNKSWCKAVWGESIICNLCGDGIAIYQIDNENFEWKCDKYDVFEDDFEWDLRVGKYEYHSTKAFKILQEVSHDAAIDYILKTMV